MRRTLVGVALALAVTSSAWAQVPGFPNGCDRCRVVSYIDIPADNRIIGAVPSIDRSQQVVVAGWGFGCEDGVPTTRVDVNYADDHGIYHWVPNVEVRWSIYRPDVRAALWTVCPRVTSTSGFAVFLAAGSVPPGPRTLAINVWVGPLYETQYRTIFIK
jgi:hypothetical protein